MAVVPDAPQRGVLLKRGARLIGIAEKVSLALVVVAQMCFFTAVVYWVMKHRRRNEMPHTELEIGRAEDPRAARRER